jgi:hypothetical protein
MVETQSESTSEEQLPSVPVWSTVEGVFGERGVLSVSTSVERRRGAPVKTTESIAVHQLRAPVKSISENVRGEHQSRSQ